MDVQARVSICECACLLYPSIFIFPLAFVLVNDLSLVSRCFFVLEMRTIGFCFCCRLFLFVVCTCILCLLPCLTRCSFIDVLSCTPTGVSEINHLTCKDPFCSPVAIDIPDVSLRTVDQSADTIISCIGGN